MCSVNDSDHDSTQFMEVPTKGDEWSLVCQKCLDGKPVIRIMQIKHAYCRDCFLHYVNHKFRSTLGKSKMMRPSDIILAGFSGSKKSLAMLHLLHAGFSEKSHKRFLFKLKVLYIDEGLIVGLTPSERGENLKRIAQLSDHYGFVAYFTTLSQLYNRGGPICTPLDQNTALSVSPDSESKLLELINSVSPLTTKEDLLRQLRKNLMKEAAKELGCGKVFVAHSSTDLAVQILTDVSLGRGAQMHNDVSFCDCRDPELHILRPMRELSSKEIAYYTVYHNLQGVQIPSLNTKGTSDASIHSLSEQFVMDLMENFPSTVSTIFRTGEKLGGGGGNSSSASKGLDEDKDNLCALCEGLIGSNTSQCSSVRATEFSRLISSLGPMGFDNKLLKAITNIQTQSDVCGSSNSSSSCCDESQKTCACSDSGGKQEVPLKDFEDSVCYGCRLIVQDSRSPACLPEPILERIRVKSSLRRMRESIQDFLL